MFGVSKGLRVYDLGLFDGCLLSVLVARGLRRECAIRATSKFTCTGACY